MRLAASLVLVAAAASSSCGDGSPAYPSSGAPSAAPGVRLLVGPSDYHEVPIPPPGHDLPAAPVAATIDIVGTTGPGAFAPNPLHIPIGQAVVWRNHDARVHHLVLDDGTSVGPIEPGQSSAPIVVSAAAVTYTCTLHPSMVGTIQDPSVAAPPVPMPEPPGDGYY